MYICPGAKPSVLIAILIPMRPTASPAERYLAALLADLDRELPRIWGRRVQTIFIGGGTPSLFPPEIIDRLLSEIRARLRPLPGLEVTLEANPGAIEAASFPRLPGGGRYPALFRHPIFQ